MKTYINPNEVTDFERDDFDLEAFAIFAVCVAGKKSDIQSLKLADLLHRCPEHQTPLQWLSDGDDLERTIRLLESVKLGQYQRIAKAIHDLAKLDLRTCPPSDLVGCHGVSHKTAAFFLVHSRANTHAVVLDTHVLSWLRRFDWEHPVPAQSPSDARVYSEWSQRAACMMRQVYGQHRSMADIDLEIWKYMRLTPGERLRTQLERHDWYYHYSDDHRVWSAGQNHWREIARCLRETPDDIARPIWDELSPPGCKFVGNEN